MIRKSKLQKPYTASVSFYYLALCILLPKRVLEGLNHSLPVVSAVLSPKAILLVYYEHEHDP